jgi:hypothetical protein
MECKTIDINNKYSVKITYNNDVTRLYRLIDKTKDDATICESFNRDAFLLKANKYVKISNKIECVIASV